MTDLKHAPRTVPLAAVQKAAESIVRLTLSVAHDARPGQFSMLWIPGVGEKPFSYSAIGEERIEFTIQALGPFTEKAVALEKGDLVGVRGSYGNGFTQKGKNVCVVGGGVGTAPLMPLVTAFAKSNVKTTTVYGYRSRGTLLFIDELRDLGVESHISTEDGCMGTKGYCSDVFDDLVATNTYDHVYACGPEPMLARVADICLREGLPCQLSVERYMKCGMGICGQCAIDPKGLLACLDGPVFTAEELKDSDFGYRTRDKAGCTCEL